MAQFPPSEEFDELLLEEFDELLLEEFDELLLEEFDELLELELEEELPATRVNVSSTAAGSFSAATGTSTGVAAPALPAPSMTIPVSVDIVSVDLVTFGLLLLCHAEVATGRTEIAPDYSLSREGAAPDLRKTSRTHGNKQGRPPF